MANKSLVPVQNPNPSLVRTASYTREQLELVKRTVCRNATDDELTLFMSTAARLGLDPFSKQIYSIERWNRESNGYERAIQIGIDGFRLVANRTGFYMPGPRPTYTFDDAGNLAGALATVLRWSPHDKSWHPIEAEVFYDEMVQVRRDGKPTRMWTQMPRVMLARSAESLAIRRAFPIDLSGVTLLADTDDAGDADDGAGAVIHRDVKPDNVFQHPTLDALTAAMQGARSLADLDAIAADIPAMVSARALTEDDRVRAADVYRIERQRLRAAEPPAA